MAAISSGVHVPEERTRQVVREHQTVYESLCRRDAEGAIEALEAHIRASTATLVEAQAAFERSRTSLTLTRKAPGDAEARSRG